MTEIFKKYENKLKNLRFKIVNSDYDRPWGGFFCIDESQAQSFSDYFFNGIDINTLKIGGKLSPKILVVRPGYRLSWQYHNRRAEIWQVYEGKVGVIQSNSDIENKMNIFKPGDQVTLDQGIRHRLVGIDDYGVVAEIWQHTKKIPSDEEDIVRVQDDFGR